jgi:hypothetical protein
MVGKRRKSRLNCVYLVSFRILQVCGKDNYNRPNNQYHMRVALSMSLGRFHVCAYILAMLYRIILIAPI